MKKAIFILLTVLLTACAPQVKAVPTPSLTNTPAPTLTPTPVAVEGIAEDTEGNFLFYEEESQTWVILPELAGDFDKIITKDDGSVVAVDKYGIEVYKLSISGEWEAIAFDVDAFLLSIQDEMTGGKSWEEYLKSHPEVKVLGNFGKRELPYWVYAVQVNTGEQLFETDPVMPGSEKAGVKKELWIPIALPNSDKLYGMLGAVELEDGTFVAMIPAYEGANQYDSSDDLVIESRADLERMLGKTVQIRIAGSYIYRIPDAGVVAWDNLKITPDGPKASPATHENQIVRRGRQSLEIFADLVTDPESQPVQFKNRDVSEQPEELKDPWDVLMWWLKQNPQHEMLLVDLAAVDVSKLPYDTKQGDGISFR